MLLYLSWNASHQIIQMHEDRPLPAVTAPTINATTELALHDSGLAALRAVMLHSSWWHGGGYPCYLCTTMIACLSVADACAGARRRTE